MRGPRQHRRSPKTSVNCRRGSTGWRLSNSTGIANRAAYNARHTTGHCDTDLTWNALCTCHLMRLTYLTADRIRDLASTGLLLHAADRVGNLAGTGLLLHTANRVGNLLPDTLFLPCALCYGNFASTGLLLHAADCVGNPLGTCLFFHTANRVGHFFRALHGNAPTDRIRDFSAADLRNHSSTGDLLVHHLRYPAATSLRPPRTLNTDLFHLTRIAWVRDALLNNTPGNVPSFVHPFAAAFLHCSAFGDLTKCRVTFFAVARLILRFPRTAADISIARFVNRAAHIVGAVPIAGFVDRTTNFVRFIAVARFVNRAANCIRYLAKTGLVNRPAYFIALVSIAGFVDRAANLICLIPVARLVDFLLTGHRHGFCAIVVHRFRTGILLRIPHNFLTHLRRNRGCAVRRQKIPSSGDRTGRKSALAQKPGFCHSCRKKHCQSTKDAQNMSEHCSTSKLPTRKKSILCNAKKRFIHFDEHRR